MSHLSDILIEPGILKWKLFSFRVLKAILHLLVASVLSQEVLSDFQSSLFISNLFFPFGNVENLLMVLWVLKLHLYKPIISVFLLIILGLFNVENRVLNLIWGILHGDFYLSIFPVILLFRCWISCISLIFLWLLLYFLFVFWSNFEFFSFFPNSFLFYPRTPFFIHFSKYSFLIVSCFIDVVSSLIFLKILMTAFKKVFISLLQSLFLASCNLFVAFFWFILDFIF